MGVEGAIVDGCGEGGGGSGHPLLEGVESPDVAGDADPKDAGRSQVRECTGAGEAQRQGAGSLASGLEGGLELGQKGDGHGGIEEEGEVEEIRVDPTKRRVVNAGPGILLEPADGLAQRFAEVQGDEGPKRLG